MPTENVIGLRWMYVYTIASNIYLKNKFRHNTLLITWHLPRQLVFITNCSGKNQITVSSEENHAFFIGYTYKIKLPTSTQRNQSHSTNNCNKEVLFYQTSHTWAVTPSNYSKMWELIFVIQLKVDLWWGAVWKSLNCWSVCKKFTEKQWMKQSRTTKFLCEIPLKSIIRIDVVKCSAH